MHIAVQRGHFGPEAPAHVEMSASGNAPRRRELPVEEDAWGCGEDKGDVPDDRRLALWKILARC